MKVRNQDDQLMKKLLNINATIMKLTNRGSKASKRCGQVFCTCGSQNCGGKRIISASDMRKIDSPVSLRKTMATFSSMSLDSTDSCSVYGSSDDEINDFSDSDCEVFEEQEKSSVEHSDYDYVWTQAKRFHIFCQELKDYVKIVRPIWSMMES